MTSEEPKVSKSGRYSVGKTCEALGICRNTLIKYVKRGDIVPMPIGESGRMRFEGVSILRFWRNR